MKKVLLVLLLLLVPTTFAKEIVSFKDSTAFEVLDIFGKVSSSYECSPHLYSDDLLQDTNICHLLSGKKYVFMPDGKNFTVDSMKIRLYDVADIKELVFKYPELDKMLGILRAYGEFISGGYPLSSVGSDGREIYLPDGSLDMRSSNAHFIEISGEKKGIGFFHMSGESFPGDIYYQMVFYDSSKGIFGGIKYFIESGKSGAWNAYATKTLGTKYTEEKYVKTFHMYVADTLLPDQKIKNIMNGIVSFLASRYEFYGFMDVPKSYAYSDSLKYLKEKNIIQGYADGTYKPGIKVNRAEFLKILLLSSDSSRNEIEKRKNESCFTDVTGGTWFNGYVCYAKANNFVKGYKDGNFHPDNTINFAEALKMSINVMNLAKVDDGVEVWYQPYIDKANELKLLSRMSINAKDEVTRGHMAEIIYQAIQ